MLELGLRLELRLGLGMRLEWGEVCVGVRLGSVLGLGGGLC